MDVVYKPKSDVVYITFKHAPVATRSEVNGDVTVNYDAEGNVAGIEVHRASHRTDDPRRVNCAVAL